MQSPNTTAAAAATDPAAHSTPVVERAETPASEPQRTSDGPAAPAFVHKRPNEWARAKDSFVSIMDEAGEAMRAFDLEKRRILGITHALSQIEQSFEALHLRFGDVERTIGNFTGERKRLEQRLDEALAVVHECEETEAELMKDNAALRSVVIQTERRLVQHAESIAAVTEENRRLRERLAASERDSGLIVDEIARIRNELIALNEGMPISAAAVVVERPAGTIKAPPAAEDPHLVSMIAELSESLEKHKREIGQLKAQIDFAPVQPAANDAPIHPSQTIPDTRPAGGGGRIEPEAFPIDEIYDGAYEEAFSTPPGHSRDDDPPPELHFGDTVMVEAINQSRDGVDVNALCSIFERRSMELRAELAREQRDRKLAEQALQTARNERAQLNRELARLRVKTGRATPPETADAPAPSPTPSRREISAA